MNTYLRKFTSKLPEIQRLLLDGFLRRLRAEGSIPTDAAMEAIRNSVTISGGGAPITRFTEVDPNSSMADANYNAMMDSLHIDLGALFANSIATSSAINRHEGISKEWVSDINSAMDVMDGRIDEFKKLVGNSDGYTAVHNENFSEVVGGSFLSTIIDNGELTIRPSVMGSTAGRPVRVTTTPYPSENHAAGIYMAAPAEHDVEADYNRKHGTGSMLAGGTQYPGYWVSVVLTDDDIKSYIDGATYYGYVVLLRLFLEGPRHINRLEIDPVGKYRTYIRRIRYRRGGIYTTDASGWENLTTVDIDNNNVLVGGSDYGRATYRFPPVHAGAMEIMFNVIDKDVLRYHIDPDVVRNALLWDELADREYDHMVDKWKGMGTQQSRQSNITSAGEEDATTDYLSRTVVGMSKVDTYNDILGTIRSSLNIDESTELERVGGAGAAILTDAVAATALGDNLTDINKNEYVTGAYSVIPSLRVYPPSGVFLSHSDLGYDTVEAAIREASLESTQETPAMTSIEYYVVTDTGKEVPIAPRGTTTYRERVKSVVDNTGNITFDLTFTPSSIVTLYKWEGGGRVTVDTAVPTGRQVSFTGLDQETTYVVEYTLDTTTSNPQLVDIPAEVPSSSWRHVELPPQRHTVALDTTPYVDYGYYDWDTSTWGYASGVAGHYSDPDVLVRDMSSSMWSFGTGISDQTFVSGTRSSMTINANFATSGNHSVIFTGTAGEYNEYSYHWVVGVGASGVQDITMDDGNLVTPAANVNANLYEPIELFIDGYKAEDKTNYKEDTQDPLEDYSIGNRYQFYILGNHLYTNVDFDSVPYKRIAVKYRYLTAYLRLKCVLYSNVDESSYYTPSIDSYQLKFMGEAL